MPSPVHLLTDTVTIATPNGRSNAGDPSFAAQTTVAARVELDTRIVEGADGSTTESTHVVLTLAEVKKGSRIWLPGDNTADNKVAKRAISIKEASIPSYGYTIWEIRV